MVAEGVVVLQLREIEAAVAVEMAIVLKKRHLGETWPTQLVIQGSVCYVYELTPG